jgi:hypothetical protein
MSGKRNRQVFGLVAVAAGLVALLANLGIYQISEPISGLLTGVVGAAFLGVYVNNRERWWAIIPGVILLAMGGVIIVARYGNDDWAGVLTLGGVGLAFVGVLLARPDAWWAVIPAGALLSLATMVFSDEILGMKDPAPVLFFGLALTFGILGLVRVGERRMRWPLVPAGVLCLFGALYVAGRPDLFNLVWPAGLILGGLYYVLRGGKDKPPVIDNM